ncbi:hypothetical protein [Amycolatopsis tolypomycina]|uniref:hypothetical protein n=1 Tax=Amycolatopsis tolypomycina TaxID=208445 RepID=UPI0033AAC63A
MSTTTVYISIGNTDHKLSQEDWSDYSTEVIDAVHEHAEQVLGEYYSASNAPHQNACIAARIPDSVAGDLRTALAEIRTDYGKSSIAWAVVKRTERV